MKTQHDSPALSAQSDTYPAAWRGKVPLKVKMAKTVTSDLPVSLQKETIKLEKDKEYFVWCNSHGALAGITDTGKPLGLKAYEFEIIEWHDTSVAKSS